MKIAAFYAALLLCQCNYGISIGTDDINTSSEPKMLPHLQHANQFDSEVYSAKNQYPQQFPPVKSGVNSISSKLNGVDEEGSHIAAVENGKYFGGDIIPTFDEINYNYGHKMAEKLKNKGLLLETHHHGMSNELQLGNFELKHLWPKRVDDVTIIPYAIKQDDFSKEDITGMELWVDEVGRATGVIKFVKRTTERHYIDVRKLDGCHSVLGYVADGAQELSMGEDCVWRDVTQHEFFHAIGYEHEHQRSDRDKYVTVNLKNVEKNKASNLRKTKRSSTLGKPYDYGSVMHYEKDGFSKNGRDTITSVGGEPFGTSLGASELDLIMIRLAYQCKSGPRSYSKYESEKCTKDCPCWENAKGCKGNDTCQGSLVCKSNTCQFADGKNRGGGERPWDSCLDLKKECAEWASYGECESEADFMLKECKSSCKVCTDHKDSNLDSNINYPDVECKDKHEKCPQWAKTNRWAKVSNCKTFPSYMLKYCKKSCGKCNGNEGPNDDQTQCFDKKKMFCKRKANKRRCKKSKYRSRLCKKSCGSCDDGGNMDE